MSLHAITGALGVSESRLDFRAAPSEAQLLTSLTALEKRRREGLRFTIGRKNDDAPSMIAGPCRCLGKKHPLQG